MKKINKVCHLATKYCTWEQGLENTNTKHPEYNSSQGTYYLDIVMNLFNCQNGLCAYTEMLLCSSHYYSLDKWDIFYGIYVKPNAPKRPEIKGQLEHFDRKKNPNKSWLWANFFMADTDVNTRVKFKRSVDDILKPDSANYNEFELLEYNSELNIFIANTELSKAKQIRINKMIKTLGLNFDPVKNLRRMYLKDKIKMIELNVENWDTIEIEQFPTAFEMIKREKNPYPSI